MNKLLLNQTARNHIKFFPMKDTIDDLPKSEADRIRWCRQTFKQLQYNQDTERLVIYKKRGSYQISVWKLDGLCYLVQCLRNEFGTYNTVIYVSKFENDMISIAKFLKMNIEQIMEDYKDQILEARDTLLREQYEEEVTDDEPVARA